MRPYQIGTCSFCRKPICSHPLDARETVLFNNSAGHELFLGRRLFSLQGYRPEPSNRSNGNTSLRFGWTLFALCLALVAWSCAAGQGPRNNLPDGTYPFCGGPAATGVWESTGYRRQLVHSNGFRAPGYLRRCRYFPSRAYWTPSLDGLCPWLSWCRVASRGLAHRVPVGGF